MSTTDVWHFLSHLIGTDNVSGPWYGFWSGFGSDIAEFGLIGALIATYRHHKCTVCWRLSRHSVEGTHYRTCHRHLTIADHAILRSRHKRFFPEQHKLLSKGDTYAV
jgi:hypothetical protein